MKDILILSNKWHKHFIEVAKLTSNLSKDPSTQVGAVVVDRDRRILATGYNGFPKGIADTEERLNNRIEKYKHIIHAEMNCIYNATFNGVSLNNSILYVYGLPICSDCAKGLIQVGIKTVHICSSYTQNNMPDKWKEHWNISKLMFNEAGVEIINHDRELV
jgi:dCMP deaminase